MPTLIITNTAGNTLDRGCKYSLLLHAGKEAAVVERIYNILVTKLIAHTKLQTF